MTHYYSPPCERLYNLEVYFSSSCCCIYRNLFWS